MVDSGFDLVEHRVKQLTNSFTESRHLLAEIEDELHATNQLRRGEPDKISEVDTELLRASSSIQGGWERVNRLKGKVVVQPDDPILFALDKSFIEIERTVYSVLLDAHTEHGFLDYGSLISTSQRASKPLVDAFRDLTSRLRQALGSQAPSEVTPPSSANDRSEPRRQPPARGLRGVQDPTSALGSRRGDRNGSSGASYHAQTRKGSSLTTSSYSGSGYDSDSYRSDSDQFDGSQSRGYTSFSSQSTGSNSRSTQSSWSHPDERDCSLRGRPPPLSSSKSRNQSETSQPRVVSSIQEELPDLNIGPLTLSPNQLHPAPFDSRNNSTSDDGGHHSQIYGSSWKSSSIATPDTVPSPVSPVPPRLPHDEVVYQSNMGKVREISSRNQPAQGIRRERVKKHESLEAVSPHSQPRKKYPIQSLDSFGPPPAPPPIGRLPELPRPIKVSLFPINTRRDLYNDVSMSPASSVPRSADSKYSMNSTVPIPIIPAKSSSRQQTYNPTPSEQGFSPKDNIGTHGLKYTPPLSTRSLGRLPDTFRDSDIPPEVLAHPGTLVDFGAQEPKSASLPPVQEINLPNVLSPTIALEKQVTAEAWTMKQSLFKKKKPSISSTDNTIPPSRPSLQTTSSEGTIMPEKWRCLTHTVKQIPGLASPPVELVPSTSPSTRPADNLPNESNKFWTLCRNAVAMQTGEGKKSAEEVAVRPTGLTGNEKFMKCRKCKYEYGAFATAPAGKAVTDPRWKDGPGGIMYKETILFKSHVTTKKDKLPQEEYHFGCVFCAATGNGMPIYKGKTSFLTHLADHGNGNYPNEVIKTRIKFTTRQEHEPNAQDTYFELVFP